MKMLADFMPGMMGYWTKDLRSTFANREYLNWFGKSADEIRGIPIQDLLGDELFLKHEPYIRAALAGKPQTFDYTLILTDEAIKETLVHYIPHLEGNEVLGIFVLIVDITERKSLELSMLAMAEERQRLIGQELHDNLGQQIAAIAYQAQVLKHRMAESGFAETAAIADSIATAAHDAVVQCKHLARGLLPLELETHSIVVSLQQFAASIAGVYGISCDFICDREITIDDDYLAINLYRIAQEATHNAIDHGAAQHLTINLTTKAGLLSLSICDDGCGLSGSNGDREAKPGMGIRNMQYRANQIGAKLTLQDCPGGGTEVLVEMRAA